MRATHDPDSACAEIARLEERLALSDHALAVCLDFLQDPDRPEATIRLARLLIDREWPISDHLHERLLRAHLNHQPCRLDLTETLIRLLLKRGNSVVPTPIASIPPAQDALADLIAMGEAAAGKDDEARCYAAHWQAILQHADSPVGWAVFALALAEHGRWSDARQAIRSALRLEASADPRAANALLKAIDILAEEGALQDVDVSAFLANLPAELKSGSGAASAPVELSSDRWRASLRGALAAYYESDFDAAYRHFRDAFEGNVNATLREIVTQCSSHFSRTIGIVGAQDEIADWLTEYSLSNPVETLISPSGSRQERHRLRVERENAIERGLPSVFFVPHAKTASTTVGNIFSSGFGLPPVVYSLIGERVIAPWLTEYMRGGACYVTHLRAEPLNAGLLASGGAPNVIVHVRDPRQLIVSIVEHHRRYPDQIPEKRRALFARDADQAFSWQIEVALPRIVSWINDWISARSKLKIDFTTFEEFVTAPAAFVERIVGLYGGNPAYFDRQAATTEQLGTDYHRRLGSTDEWRSRLSKAQIDLINRGIPAELWRMFNWKE